MYDDKDYNKKDLILFELWWYEDILKKVQDFLYVQNND